MSRDWSWPILFVIIAGIIWALVDSDTGCGPAGEDEYGCIEERESQQF